MMASQQIHPFKTSVPEAALDDLRCRIDRTRWPEAETVTGWSQGVPLSTLQTLCRYWARHYDWRSCERFLNGLGQSVTSIDGLDIHFLHVRSRHANALPLLLTHGWPGSILEFRHVIAPLTDPTHHGGNETDAFHLVIPSLPGFGFSQKPFSSGWTVERIALAWAELMRRLGYERYVAQGGDWGADVAAQMGATKARGCCAVHLNSLYFPPSFAANPPNAEEALALKKMDHFENAEAGYFKQQATRPQTIGYGLADSPAAQAAWLYEKIHAWSDHNGQVLLSQDEILDNITLFWLTNTAASSARLYWESIDNTALQIDLPVAVSLFTRDINVAPRAWAERCYSNLIHWHELDAGGHFAAWEQPHTFIDELRDGLRSLR